MTIKVGDRIPSATLMQKQDGGPKPVKTDDLFAGKKVVVFALPGAFTPPARPSTCRASSRTPMRSSRRASTPSPASRSMTHS